MKVSFSMELKHKSGKQNFAVSLAKAMSRRGIKITSPRSSHVHLVFVKGVKKGGINVLRLDGAWMNSKINSAAKNAKIRKVMKQCKGVIYQSKYSRKVCRKMIGHHKRSCIIYNGCDPKYFRNPHKHSKPYILTYSRWRPHKRLNAIVEGFLSSGVSQEYDLLVGGEVANKVNHDSILYLGNVEYKKMMNIVAGSTFVVHLAYLDCCPNSVVESLVAGKPVLCSSSGGTGELVRGSGYQISDVPYSYDVIDLYNIDIPDIDKVIKGYISLAASDKTVHRQDLHIDTVADQYIKYLRTLI